MNIHEYQAKSILRTFEVPVPDGIVIDSASGARNAAEQIYSKLKNDVWVVKAQIHAGGRGKGGGIKVAKSVDEVEKYSREIIGMKLITPQTDVNGKIVHKVLIEQGIYYKGQSPVKEFYISFLLNRNTGRNMVVYSPKGGMDIEAVAEQTPELIFTEEIDPKVGLLPFQARKIASDFSLTGKAYYQMVNFMQKLAIAYKNSDALLIEINPVIKTSDDLIIAADAKFTLDDNALFRHPEYDDMRDIAEEDPSETKAVANSLNFVKLNGNVGCLVNGAGLAMATMDIIKYSGGAPANFLDVGGSANAKRVDAAFHIILNDPGVKAILVNIFGGIVRCDRVAQGIVDAYKTFGSFPVPLIVRLQGTNALEAKQLIDSSGLEVYSAISLQEAADLLKEILGF